MIYDKYMQKCFRLAEKGRGFVSPNPLVGCIVLDKDNNIISKGYHHKYGENHAEREALLKLKNGEENGGTLIVNLEPCSHFGKTPPCVDLIIERKLKRVIIAMQDVNPIVAGNGIKKLKNAGIEVVEHVLEKEAKSLNEVFIKNMVNKTVFIAVKTAVTLDGKISTSNGSSMWITSSKARDKGKLLRKYYDAVLTTSSTVLADNPKFDCKTKILIDRTLKCDFSMQYFKTGNIFVVTSKSDYPKCPKNVTFVYCPEKSGKLDLLYLFEKLYRMNIMSVFVEAGGTLNGELLKLGLIDKIYMFQAPKILGDNNGKSAFEGNSINDINKSFNFEIESIENLSPDILLTLKK